MLPSLKFQIKEPKVYSKKKIRRIDLSTMESELEEINYQHMTNPYMKIKTEGEYDDDKEKEQLLIQKLQDENELPFDDQMPKEFIGQNAIHQYFRHYKRLDKIKEQNKQAQIQNTAHTNLLSKSEVKNLLPCKLGLIKYSGNKTSLSIPNHMYGDNYSQVLSEGLKDLQIISDFNLSKNRLKESGASQLLSLITRQARVLELNSNKVGRKGSSVLASNIQNKYCRIETLNLEDNGLGDENVASICGACCNNKTLMQINLSKNTLTNVESINSMMSVSYQIQELYLHWNSIKTAASLFETLAENESLKVLDLSYNLLGSSDTSAICLFLTTNKSLLHLDLSSNNFGYSDCQSISEALAKNHTIYGFHFMGNYGYVDTKGFLILNSSEKSDRSTLHVKQRIQGLQPVIKPYSMSERIEKYKNVCWICDGWHQEQFTYKLNDTFVDSDPVFLHLDYENYDSVYLGKMLPNQTFSKKRMVPPGWLKYIYTVGDVQYANPDEPIKKATFRRRIAIQDELVEAMLDEHNERNYPQPNILFDEDFKALVEVVPRTPDEIYIAPRRKKAKRIWTFPISIWAKKYQFETEDILRKCFEQDWKCSKLTKFIKNPEDQNIIKEMLWEHYRIIKECYKNYASYNPNGDIFSISQNPMSELMNNCELIDGKTLKIADVDLKFIATCSASSMDYKGNARNPERAIVRFQLLEFLVRLAEDKYVRGNQNTSIILGTKQMLEQCKQHMSTFDAHKWRMERYFTEQCDDCCKKYKFVADYVYSRYSKKKVKPGQQPFMCLDELKDICNKLEIYDENFVDRDVNVCFNLSMMTQVDELDTDRIFQMKWIEFLEALARIAEKISLPKVGSDQDEDYNKRNQQPLYYKLESLFVFIIKKMVDDDTRRNMNLTIPQISMFDIQEEDEYY